MYLNGKGVQYTTNYFLLKLLLNEPKPEFDLFIEAENRNGHGKKKMLLFYVLRE